MSVFHFDNRVVGDGAGCYVIAEIGVNHEGSFDLARTLIDRARDGGADAAKFQSYKADTLASRHSPAYWDTVKEPTTSQYELFKKYDGFGAESFARLAGHCRDVGIDFLSTPFDEAAVGFLTPLVPAFKIASADVTNVPLLRQVAATGRAVMLSVGASTHAEVRHALQVLHEAGAADVALMHCVLNYPTAYDDANLDAIADLRRIYPDAVVGYSDHTPPDPAMAVLTTAYLKGARIFEKHFTHDKTLPGNDHYHAMDVDDLKCFRRQLSFIQRLEGGGRRPPLDSEQAARRNARRSLVLARDVQAGTTITPADLIPKRPGTGISPLHCDVVVGSRVASDLEADHVLAWADIRRNGRAKGSHRVVAVIQARMGSARFPGKMMALLAGRPLVEWILARVTRTTRCDDVILAIPDSAPDDVLEDVAQRMGVQSIRGDERDVLSRVVNAARAADADWVVRVCGDNPFIDPVEIDRLIDFAAGSDADYAFNHQNGLSNAYPDGFGAEIVSRAVLEDMNQVTTEVRHREHVTSYLWDNPFAYRMRTLAAPAAIAFPHLRFDVDSPADLERLAPLAEQVGLSGTALDFIQAELPGRAVKAVKDERPGAGHHRDCRRCRIGEGMNACPRACT